MIPFGGGALLGLLGAGVRGLLSGAGGGSRQEGSIEALGFEELLSRARGGELSSGRGVTATAESGVKLDEAALSRIAAAVDRAEASGADRALVLHGGVAYEVDVSARRIEREWPVGPGLLVAGVGAVVSADGPGSGGPGSGGPGSVGSITAGEALRLIGGFPPPGFGAGVG